MLTNTLRILQPVTRLLSLMLLISSLHPTRCDVSLNTQHGSIIGAGGRAKRYSNFVRVGRGGTFLRIGKSSGWSDANDDFSDNFEIPSLDTVGVPRKRQMHRFIRIGRGMDSDDGFGSVTDRGDYMSDMGEMPFDRVAKSPSNFVRIGKSPSSFVRIGKSPSTFVRIGKDPNSFVRIGKALFDNPDQYNDKRSSSFVRIGRSVSNSNDPLNNLAQAMKKSSSFVRIGKSPSFLGNRNQAKRASSFVRIGKSHLHGGNVLEENSKRASSFVRIGKSNFGDAKTMADILKRPSSFVRIGKSKWQQGIGDDKRAGNFLRIGRLAGSEDDKKSVPLDTSAEKRGFVRIGKKDESKILKPVSKSQDLSPSSDESMQDGNPTDDKGPINVTNRGSAFVRIGKIPSSAFVRIGKNTDVMLEDEPRRVYPFSRGSRGGHSSFVRIG